MFVVLWSKRSIMFSLHYRKYFFVFWSKRSILFPLQYRKYMLYCETKWAFCFHYTTENICCTLKQKEHFVSTTLQKIFVVLWSKRSILFPLQYRKYLLYFEAKGAFCFHYSYRTFKSWHLVYLLIKDDFLKHLDCFLPADELNNVSLGHHQLAQALEDLLHQSDSRKKCYNSHLPLLERLKLTHSDI